MVPLHLEILNYIYVCGCLAVMAWIVIKWNDDEHFSFSVFSGEKIVYNLKFLQLFFIYIC